MRGGGAVWEMSSTCVQGGIPRPLGGYQPNLILEPRSPAPAWQLHHPIVPKQEPMDEDRNDSGTGSDFHSSSPGSEASHDYNPTAPSYSSSQITPQPPSYYTTPLGYHVNVPYAKNLQVPKEDVENEDPLRRLQNIAPPAPSPKTSEHSDDNKSDFEGEEYDEQGLRIPRMNSHGKVKTHKCKQCDFVAITKLDFWEHSKVHIKPDKLLTCPRCPFVTEFKHHLEYHLRNHVGSKPFKCDQCSYACVNKSMLNSHMKSHSSVYQYRCADCSYATKYCHSLKLHLRKYTHKPAMVLNPDGTPNPLPIIDVYGTRRGPKQRSSKGEEVEATTPTNVLQNQLAHFMLNASPQMPLPFPYHFLAGFSNPLMSFPPGLEELVASPERPRSVSPPPQNSSSEALDLSKPEIVEQQPKSRRKGRAFKLANLPVNDSEEEEEKEEEPILKKLKECEESTPEIKSEEVGTNNNNNGFSCQYCNISFGDIILYTMHMGYHGFNDPFTCNMCGEQCKDKVSFFLHIARNPHT